MSLSLQTLLTSARWRADPLADAVVRRLAGPWPAMPEDEAQAPAVTAPVVQRLQAATRAMGQWTTNASLATWQAGPELPSDIGAALQDYLREARALPAWADAALVERAEQVFLDHGALSCTLLFCASLPECYVLPDLSAVLHATAELEDRTEHRVRATAAMVFPVMLPGGLMSGAGSGIAQVLKVRLIHATVRHLVLRGAPSDARPKLAPWPTSSQQMHQALAAHGWDVAAQGLPCNQLELAYTLLTFHYVFLRGLRSLHIPLDARGEEAYLHAWNVMGHVLGIEAELMPHGMAEAQRAFEQMQALGRAHEAARRLATRRDCRPALGQALMQCVARVIPGALLKPMPTLLTRHLCGPATAHDIGIATQTVPWASRFVFGLALGLARLIDSVMRLFSQQFSLSRFLTRLVGYRLVSRLLMDQTRPLSLPEHLHEPMRQTVRGWSDDPHAPAWLNALEDRLTTRGPW
jgi:hypothetical protein